MTHQTSRSRFPQLTSGALVLGGVCWILAIVFYVGQAIAQAAWKTPYSLLDNPVSDLGNTACGVWPPASMSRQIAQRLGAVGNGYVCSPLHTVMNGSFLALGVLLLLGLFFTRHAWPRRRLTTWGFAFLVLAGLGKIVVGLAPENTNVLIHFLGGLGIPCGSIGMVLLGLAVWPTRRSLAIFSLALGGLGLLGFLGGFVVIALGHGTGAAERVTDEPLIVWMVVLGISFVLWWRASRVGEQPASA